MPQQQDDLSLLSVRSAFDHLQATINRALQRIERQAQLDNHELFNEIKERKKLAKLLKLDQRLIRLYYYLAAKPGLKIEPTPGFVRAELSNAVITTEANTQRLRFQIDQKHFALQLSETGAGSISYYGETFKAAQLSLFEGDSDADDKLLITLHLNMSGEGCEQSVSESQITAFIPGKWIYDIIHMDETLATKDKLSAIEQAFSDERLMQLKQRFGIV